jgi:threonyl-tRNA synthetase
VGEKEEQDFSVAVRRHGQGDQGTMRVQAFAEKVCGEIKDMLSV